LPKGAYICLTLAIMYLVAHSILRRALNKQSFYNQSMYTCMLRATRPTLSFMYLTFRDLMTMWYPIMDRLYF
jgi:hypothetical protein